MITWTDLIKINQCYGYSFAWGASFIISSILKIVMAAYVANFMELYLQIIG
jgi:hypothetical protein